MDFDKDFDRRFKRFALIDFWASVILAVTITAFIVGLTLG